MQICTLIWGIHPCQLLSVSAHTNLKFAFLLQHVTIGTVHKNLSYQQSAKKSEQNLGSWPVWSVECNQQILKKVLKQRPVIFFIFTNTYASTILNAYYELHELNIIHSKITHDQHVIIRTKKSSILYTVHYTFKI